LVIEEVLVVVSDLLEPYTLPAFFTPFAGDDGEEDGDEDAAGGFPTPPLPPAAAFIPFGFTVTAA
jgi:hypothetical protein